MSFLIKIVLVALLALSVPSLLPPDAQAHNPLAHDPQDELLTKVGVDEKAGAAIPLQLLFTDQGGRTVQLSRYFTGGPVILSLNYYSCPTLCSILIKNLAGSIVKMRNFIPGKDFRVVTVSIDPNETLQRASETSAKTYAMLGSREEPGDAWPFLTGSQGAIGELAGSVGVRYARAKNGEFAHPNVLIILTPDGRISRYLYGMEQTPQDLRLALIEASGGSIGHSKLLNRALLYCFHYDPVGKKYELLASRVMTGTMTAVGLIVAGVLALLWKREKTTG
jgi:protein SCO1